MPPETMEELLAPWLMLAMIVYPSWRSVVHDAGGRDVPKGELPGPRPRTFVLQTTPASGWSLREMFRTFDKPLDAARQVQLRELLEILVLAVRVDARTLVDLACDGRHRTLLTCEPFDTYPWIPRLHIHAYASPKLPATSDFYKAFFDWDEDSASEEFKESKAALTELLVGRVEVPGPRFEVKLDLKLRSQRAESRTLQLAPMIQLLRSFDRQVFRVVQIALTIEHSTFTIDELTELFRLIHGFHDETDVLIRLQLCQDKPFAVSLNEWMPIVDLVAKKTFPNSASRADDSYKKSWDIEVACGVSGLEDDREFERSHPRVLTDARLIAACYFALAHAGAHVTSIHLINPLTDKTSEFRGPSDGTSRAEWLGYLLRAGTVDRFVLDEPDLRVADIRELSNVLDQKKPFRLLWNCQKHRTLERTQRGCGPQFEDSDRYEDDPGEVVLRLTFPTCEDDDLGLDAIFSADMDDSYGQYSVAQPLDRVVATTSTRKPESPIRLKSLTIRVPGDSDPDTRLDAAILDMVVLLRDDLEELTIHGARVKFSLSFLIRILDVCLKLRRLDIETLDMGPGDLRESSRLNRRSGHPLQELVLGIQLDEQSRGLEALSKCLVALGLELCEFRVRVKAPHRPMSKPRLHPVEKMLLACCRSCSVIEVSGLAVDYFRALYNTSMEGAFPELSTLVLNGAVWTNTSWSGLLAALSAPTHSLARSLHTLVIHSPEFTTVHDEQMTEMLAKNHMLVNVGYIAQEEDDCWVQETNGAAMKRLKKPFGLRHKAAFMSVVETSKLPGFTEAFVITNIFEFAREYEVRRVIVS